LANAARNQAGISTGCVVSEAVGENQVPQGIGRSIFKAL
jgi:hypothetical protein